MKNSKEELVIILKAIRTVRLRWLKIVRKKAAEIHSYTPNINRTQAFHQALVNGETQEEFQNLLRLYGIVGDCSADFIEALTEEPEAEVLPLRKRVA